ncbi:MAG: GTPase domain-containing protein [Lachnospiraceae bacterium]|nr:GTPase domain-containing protein [Lachnospiraceae bacterium]
MQQPNNADILTTNVLIIGKSGAGKSSLLNYLFDQKLEKTGVGAPITEKGIFPHDYELDSETKVRVYDTWGLEADKADEWQELVRNEIRKHDGQSIKDWFHTIIYCLNANSDRIEPFETDFISMLLKEGNNVTVVLTHCDVGRTKNTIDGIKRELNSKGVASNNIIEVSNEAKKLIGGKQTERFGKEKVWEKIKKGLWDKIIEKLPKDLRSQALAIIDEGKNLCYEKVDKTIKLRNVHSNKIFEELNEKCNQILVDCNDRIRQNYENKINEAIDFYLKIYNRFFAQNEQNAESRFNGNEEMLKYSMEKVEILNERFGLAFLMAMPGVNLLLPFMIADMKRDEYKEEIEKYIDKMKDNVYLDEKSLREHLEKMLME